MVLLNILSSFLFQFSTKLAWSTRDIAELGRGRGGAATTALHFTITLFTVAAAQAKQWILSLVCVQCHQLKMCQECTVGILQRRLRRGYTAPYRPGSLWHTVHSWEGGTRVLGAVGDIVLWEPFTTLCVQQRMLNRLSALSSTLVNKQWRF